jgi:glycosyltransferase involved in cell wall biosynthesis
MKWICAQIGAREHYAISRALAKKGNLDCLITDFWCPPGNILGFLSSSLKGRYHPELSLIKVRSNNTRSLWQEYKRRMIQDPYLGFVNYGRWFSLQIRELMRRTDLVSPETLFFSYDTGFLDAAEYVKRKGGKCVVCQMDPGETEQLIVRNEHNLWPGWSENIEVPCQFNIRRRKEWELADIVMVNSEWSKNALIDQGVSGEKILTIPLCYEPERFVSYSREGKEDFKAHPLKVLWLGSVNLRKGIQYVVNAAQMLEGSNIRFDVVGSLEISKEIVDKAPPNMVFHGRCLREQTASWYDNADIFILPTLSDGFAITQIEAMAHGLPVITTKCCGAVVSEGEDGFIVPERDSKALADSISYFYQNHHELGRISRSAYKKARQFGMTELIQNLSNLESFLASVAS